MHPAAILIFLITAFTWYGIIFYRYPDQASFWIGKEIDATYITGVRANPFYYYFPGVFSYFIPWSVFLVPAGIWLYKTYPHPQALQFAIFWFVLTFIILSLNVTKQTQYALLLDPSLSIILGYYLGTSRERYARINRILYIALILLLVATLAVLIFKWKDAGGFAGWKLLLLGAAAFLPLVSAKLLFGGKPFPDLALVLAGVLSCVWVYGEHRSHNAPDARGAQVKQLAFVAKNYSPLFTYRNPNPRISFYLGRPVPVISGEREVPALLACFSELYLIVPDETPNWDKGVLATEVMRNKKHSFWKLIAKDRMQ